MITTQYFQYIFCYHLHLLTCLIIQFTDSFFIKQFNFRQIVKSKKFYNHSNPFSIGIKVDRYFKEQNQQQYYLVDLGCSLGYFIKQLGQMIPDKNFLGLEIRKPVVEQAQQKCQDNVKIITCNCKIDLPVVLNKQSINIFTIMFPDPCFKERQTDRRLVTTQFVIELLYYLKQNGYILICTDVDELFEYMLNEIQPIKQLKQIYKDTNQLTNIPQSQELKTLVEQVHVSPMGKLYEKQQKPWQIIIYQYVN